MILGLFQASGTLNLLCRKTKRTITEYHGDIYNLFLAMPGIFMSLKFN